jgi:tol-pal system protein YbgF
LGATLAVMILASGVLPASTAAQVNIFGGGEQQSSATQQQQAQISLRLQQIEQQLRQLTGQVEQLTFQNQQLQDQMRRMQQDYEFRLQELETNKKPQKRSDAGPSAPPPATEPPTEAAAAPTLDDLPRAAPNQQAALGETDLAVLGAPPATLGAPPAVLGQIPATDDPIGASLNGAGPLDLRPGGAGAASGTDVPPGIDPKLAALPAVPNPRAEYDAAYGYVLSGEWPLAQASFERFIANHPTDRRVGSAMYWLGEAFSARRQFREAADAYLKSYTQYPDDPKAPDSLFKLGVTLGNLGERQAACATYGELLDKYPRASKALRDRATTERQRARCG